MLRPLAQRWLLLALALPRLGIVRAWSAQERTPMVQFLAPFRVTLDGSDVQGPFKI